MHLRSALTAALWVAAWVTHPAPATADPPVAPESREVRPPDEPGRRGLVSVPAWVVWATTAATLAIAAGALLRGALGSRPR